MTNYWLIKSEPDAYSIDDLKKDTITPWDGIRNYQARNFMRDDMKEGDLALFYHSNAKPPGVVGVAKVCSTPYPDVTAFEEGSKYFDPKSDPDNPRWVLVDFAFVSEFEEMVPLPQMREDPKLAEMLLLKKGQRLSIQPVEKRHFDWICGLGGEIEI